MLLLDENGKVVDDYQGKRDYWSLKKYLDEKALETKDRSFF